MTKHVFLVLLTILTFTAKAQVDFTARVVARNMHIPWDLVEGPDGKIWVTNRDGVVERITMDTGERDTLADYRNLVENASEAGLLGLAIHPAFPDSPYVFLAYVFTDFNANETRVKQVARLRYDSGKLVDRTVIYEYRPAALWHIGCRLLILPDTTLLLTNGDQPTPDSAMSVTSDVGKIVRINLDGSIPADNPFPGSRAYSMGHRNPQGLVRLPSGHLYSSEHGDNIDDEINVIVPGGNYGWPLVEGMCDLPEEKSICTDLNLREPLWASGNPTLAPSGIDYYNHDRYPALKNSVLCAFLKASRMTVFSLSEDFNRITKFHHMLTYRYGRIRDILVTKDGRIFLSTGNVGYNGIDPFPKETDDKLIELMPVWEQSNPQVRPLQDTVVFRADPGEELPSAVEFCSNGGTPVTYTRFYTNPGNIFEARFWQDLASTEGTDCYPFRMMFRPDTVMPRSTLATVWYTRPDGALDTSSATVIGLPRSGYARSMKDTVEYVSTQAASCSIVNIGSEPVTVFSVSSVPPGLIAVADGAFPRVLAPGEVFTFDIAVVGVVGLGSSLSVQLNTNSFGNPSFVLKRVLASSVAEDSRVPVFTLSPNPADQDFRITLADAAPSGITITDLLGRIVYTDTVIGTTHTITVRALSETGLSGMYSVTVTQNGSRATAPLLILR